MPIRPIAGTSGLLEADLQPPVALVRLAFGRFRGSGCAEESRRIGPLMTADATLMGGTGGDARAPAVPARDAGPGRGVGVPVFRIPEQPLTDP